MADVKINRGTTLPPVVWRLLSKGQPFNNNGWGFALAISWRGRVLRADSSIADGRLSWDATTGTLTWNRTTAETDALPAGRVATWFITRYQVSNPSRIAKVAEGRVNVEENNG